MNSDLTEDQWKQMADTEDQVELGELGMPAVGDQDRCSYTVHANGNWGDYRCELVVDHPGPHAIGLRYHAVPLIGSIIPFAADLREERDALRKRGWWHRMSNEDIAAELSATFDLGLDTTRKIAEWILKEKEE